MRKSFLFALALVLSVGAFASTVSDLVPINRNWTFIADDHNSNGTAGWTDGTLYCGGYLLSLGGNSVATNKGTSTIGSVTCKNSLRLKNAQNRLAFAVADACTVTFYTQGHASRGILVSTMDNNTDPEQALGQQPVSTTVWAIDLPAGTYYLTSYSGDFFFAGFTVEFEGGGEPVTEVEVRYYDADGTTLIGCDTLDSGAALTYKYSASDVTVPAGQAFRGWFESAELSAHKVPEGTLVNADMRLYAHATDIETATVGSVYNWDFTKDYFYQEDHELITITNGSYYNNHGWAFGANGTIAVQTAGNAIVKFSLCKFGNAGTIICQDANGNPVGETINTPTAEDGGAAVVRYIGAPTMLTFTLSGGYIHGVKIFNIANVPTQNEAGYYVMQPNDGAGLLLMLETAQDGDKIFLPNGTYDFGNTTLTHIAKSISLVGQSMEGVLIVNHPLNAGMNGSETLFIETGAEGVYFQDLAIRCDVSYEGSIAGGVGIALQARGDKHIMKRVDLQGNQDTYLSAGQPSQRAWYEDCRIEGTVDYVCGGGNIWFENTLFYNNARTNADVIFAPSTSAETVYGYVMNNCTVDGAAGQDGRWNIARGWKDRAAVTLLNTTCLIAPSAQGYTHMGAGLDVRFHEYNTHLEDGTVITGHNLDGLNYGENADPIYMTNDSIYTYANVIKGEDNWDAQAIAADAIADQAAIDADAAYLIENEGAFVAVLKGSELSTNIASYIGNTMRKANGRGGFGQPVTISNPTGLDPVNGNPSPVTHKVLRNGQLLILRDGKTYNVLGTQL